MAEPEDMARMALFLASDDSAYATGAPFIVDGGWMSYGFRSATQLRDH
jgi:3alpha(or 20beta)-hydroxysteroid dehydrogenase